RWPDRAGLVQRISLNDKELVHITGKRAASDFNECDAHQIIVSPVALNLNGACGVFDAPRLLKTGSLAFANGQIISSAEVTGDRLWSPRKEADPR
ncbi:MAG: competence protein, partial [Pseudomonadota bacterium]